MDQSVAPPQDRSRAAFFRWVMFIGPLIFMGPIILVGYITTTSATESYYDFVIKNYLVFFGIPLSALFSFYLVVTLEITRGDIDIEFATLKFKGASGPLIFWVITFLTLTGAMKMFWVGK